MGLADFWFLLIAVLFTGYFVLEGFDFGVGMLVGVLGRAGDDAGRNGRRQVLLHTIEPVWDGNEVWLIVAGGAMFAAFPEWYATLFSGFYLPLLLILVSLIIRACAIEFRGKIDEPGWRSGWDAALITGSTLTPLLWGVAMADIVRGVAIDEHKHVTGSVLDLLNWYGLLGGVVFLGAFLVHGLAFVALRTSGPMRDEALALGRRLAPVVVVVGAVFAVVTQLEYGKGWTWAAVALAAVALVGAAVGFVRGSDRLAFSSTTVAIVGVAVLLFGSLFPNVMPSTLAGGVSLTVDNASSSHYTLVVMTWAGLALLPVVLVYQGWTYWVFRKRVRSDRLPGPAGLPRRPAPATTGSHAG